MILLRAAGIASLGEINEQAQAALVDEAERFLLAGGRLSLADWTILSEPERDALVEAGLRIRLTRIVREASE